MPQFLKYLLKIHSCIRGLFSSSYFSEQLTKNIRVYVVNYPQIYGFEIAIKIM